eukprot:1474166-Amphidinium_carterae.1
MPMSITSQSHQTSDASTAAPSEKAGMALSAISLKLMNAVTSLCRVVQRDTRFYATLEHFGDQNTLETERPGATCRGSNLEFAY